jgi:hypothetical protein
MPATLVDFFSVYDGTTAFGSFTKPALAGDVVLVFASGYNSPTYCTATDNGNGGSNTYNQIDNIDTCDGYNTSATALLASVVHTGILTITIGTHPTDIGFVAYLLRGVDNYVESTNHSACTSNNPLVTPTQTITDMCSLFTYWAVELSGQDHFLSFNLSQSQDVHDPGHYHASGHILDLPATTYTPGVNQSSGTTAAIIIGVFLRNTKIVSPNEELYFDASNNRLLLDDQNYLMRKSS